MVEKIAPKFVVMENVKGMLKVADQVVEDYELIDKVDDELKLGKIGNTYIKEQILIPSVGNYKPQITTQNIETPMPPSGQQQEQKQLEHE